MRRGFKTQAENCAASARRKLNLSGIDALDPWKYAKQLAVVVLEFHRLRLSAAAVKQLTKIDSDSWSAMTLKEGNTLAIVVNPVHAPTRQRSDLMHELAHVELRHAPARVDVSKTGMMLLSDYSEEQEQEADWHAAALLVPRVGLVHFRKRNEQVSEIAKFYGVSEQLCEWRLRTTGVDIQIRRAKAG